LVLVLIDWPWADCSTSALDSLDRERERESGTVEQWMSVGKDGDGNNQWGGNEARREERGRGTSRRPNKTDLSMLAQI
jgi:hypothetical protein